MNEEISFVDDQDQELVISKNKKVESETEDKDEVTKEQNLELEIFNCGKKSVPITVVKIDGLVRYCLFII